MQKHAGILGEVCRRAFCWHFITYREPGCKTPFSPIRSNFRGKLGSMSPLFITHKYTQLKTCFLPNCGWAKHRRFSFCPGHLRFEKKKMKQTRNYNALYTVPMQQALCKSGFLTSLSPLQHTQLYNFFCSRSDASHFWQNSLSSSSGYQLKELLPSLVHNP